MGRQMSAKIVLATTALTAAFFAPANAEALPENRVNYTHELAHTPVYGQTLPPIGYVNFCARNASECHSAQPPRENATLVLTPKRWAELKEVNSYVNAYIQPVSDIDQHNVPEHWDYPRGAGDCEDYVLLKKRYLEGIGFPADSLLITVVLDEAGEGHAVLTARTDSGDLILDNRRNEIQRWSETRYQFLKRQSQKDPQIWVALTNKQRRSNSLISGGN